MKMELFVSDCADVTWLTLKNKGRFIFSISTEMPIEAILGHVQFAT